MTPVLESVGAIPVGDFDLRGSAIAIPLCGRGGIVRAYTFVDPCDYEWASRINWHLHKAPNDKIGYAVRSVKEGETVQTEFLHRRILGLERGDARQGDHLNRNSLDNRRFNLRIATHEQNGQNRSGHKGSSSRFRGVSWNKEKQRWIASAWTNGTQHHIGIFKTEQEAADAAARFREHNMPFATD